CASALGRASSSRRETASSPIRAFLTGKRPRDADDLRRGRPRSVWRAQPRSCYLTVMILPRELTRFIGRIKSTSSLASLSTLVVIICVFAILLTLVAGPHYPLTYALWILFIIWMVYIGAAYVFWSIKDPNRLQTENYQLQQQVIKVITDERHPGRTIENEPLTSNTNVGEIK